MKCFFGVCLTGCDATDQALSRDGRWQLRDRPGRPAGSGREHQAGDHPLIPFHFALRGGSGIRRGLSGQSSKTCWALNFPQTVQFLHKKMHQKHFARIFEINILSRQSTMIQRLKIMVYMRPWKTSSFPET